MNPTPDAGGGDSVNVSSSTLNASLDALLSTQRLGGIVERATRQLVGDQRARRVSRSAFYVGGVSRTCLKAENPDPPRIAGEKVHQVPTQGQLPFELLRRSNRGSEKLNKSLPWRRLEGNRHSRLVG